jgi:hypothetical protein
MKTRRQHGLSMVEVVIALGVTASLLVGLTAVVMAANRAYVNWNQRLYVASASVQFPAQLQADSHRFLPCSGDGPSLDFCLPTGAVVVSYRSSTPCPCNVLRTEAGGVATVVVRSLVQPPLYQPECSPGGSVAAGYISITGIQFPGDSGPRPPLHIFFRTPLGNCEG